MIVVAQLVDARTERTIWTHADQRESIDLGGLEHSLMASISAPLKFRIADSEKSEFSRKPMDIETYNLYLKASTMKDQLSSNGAAQSAKAFEEVIRRVPGYAPAHAGLANAWATFPFLRKTSPKETLNKAAEIARHAITLDPTLAEAHSALAHSYFNLWRWREAEAEFQTAVSLDPDSASTLQLCAVYLATQDRFDEAIRRANEAAKLAPTSGLMAYTIAVVHFHAGHFDEAIDAGRHTLDIDPGFAGVHNIMSRAYAMKGMLPEALASNAKWSKLGEARAGPFWAAYLQAQSGSKNEAIQILRQVEKSFGKNAPQPLAYPIALLNCGEVDRGFDALHKSVSAHVTAIIWLKATPELRKWQSQPRYLSAIALFNAESVTSQHD